MKLLIKTFADKQKFENVSQIDENTIGCDGFHFSLEDVRFDVEHNIKPGLIKLYYGEQKTDYRKWLADNYHAL